MPPLPGPEAPPLAVLPGELRTVGGYRLFVRRTPAADGAIPAVYVHGLGGSATNFTDLMTLLGARLTGWAPDLPGFGYSPLPAGRRHRFTEFTRAVTALLAEVGPAVLVGNSLGGAVATRVAATRPDLVRALVLLDPALPTRLPMRSNLVLPLLAVPGLGALLSRRVRGQAAERRVRLVLASTFADPDRVPPQRVDEAVAELERRDSLGYADRALQASLRSLLAEYLRAGRDRLWRQARQVRAPTLLVYGSRDQLVDVRAAPRAARTFRSARLRVLDGTGHVPQMEDPRAVAEEIVSFLDDARGSG